MRPGFFACRAGAWRSRIRGEGAMDELRAAAGALSLEERPLRVLVIAGSARGSTAARVSTARRAS
ncbi:hypothetical protein M446_3302 [Methylobacterium sp. 4-46]|nr:hypothetical protein M446_3302 [Methylobacterium sp. 4-46]